jgi:LPPG:FO 2-phospho-L-lactate transferase
MAKYVALCGGVGGAKLAYGLAQVLSADELTIVVNTGDDFEHLGLLICPDLDTVVYTLADVADAKKGWGRANESWSSQKALAHLGGPVWFQLGDKDLALHLYRRSLLDGGASLCDVTETIAKALGVKHSIVPMSDDPVRTIVETDEGDLPFQTYFVKRRCEPRVSGFRFEGASLARLSSPFEAALSTPDLAGVILCPSNPFVSIGPILALPGVRDRLRACNVPVLAVAPLVGGEAVKGPLTKMMHELGMSVSVGEIASLYADFLDLLVIDPLDECDYDLSRADRVAVDKVKTLMTTPDERIALARHVLACVEHHRNNRQTAHVVQHSTA